MFISFVAGFGPLEWLLVILLTVFLSMALFTITETNADRLHKRIMGMKMFTEEKNINKKKQAESIFRRIYLMAEERVSVFVDKQVRKGNLGKIEMKLLQGGYTDVKPVQFFSQKVIFGVVGTFIGILLKQPMLILVLGVLGFLYSDYRLKKKIDERQFIIKTELPDFLDMVATTYPACANIVETLEQVCNRIPNTISREFSIALSEINNGRRQREALNDLGYRTGIKEIIVLVSAINQSETFGVGLEETLQVQANSIRRLKKTMAEARAVRANIMLLIPATFLLITCIILIIGPSIMQFIDAMSLFT